MDKLSKLQTEVLAISANEPTIHNHFTSKLKNNIAKIGMSLFLTIASLSAANMAHADCSVSSANPVVTGLGAAAGAGAMAFFGGGWGKVAAVGLGAVGGGMATNAVQNASHEADCRRAASYNYGQQANFPRNMQNNQLPPVPILYTDVDANARIITVTMDGSIGLNALHGQRDGSIDPHTNATVEHALEVSENNLRQAYQRLDHAAQYYNDLRVKDTPNMETQDARYAVDNLGARTAYREKDSEIKTTIQNQNSFKNEASYRLKNFNDALENYAISRSFAAKIFDNAAADGYHLADRQEDITLFTPPQNAEITWGVVHNQALPNQYVNVHNYNKLANR